MVFQPMYRYLKKIVNTDHISLWKSKGLSDEIMKPPTASANSLSSALSYKYSHMVLDLTWKELINFLLVNLGKCNKCWRKVWALC